MIFIHLDSLYNTISNMIIPKNLFLIFTIITILLLLLLSIFLNPNLQIPSVFHHLNLTSMTSTPGLKISSKLIKNSSPISMKPKSVTILSIKLQQHLPTNTKSYYLLAMKSPILPLSKIALFKLPKKPFFIFILAKIKTVLSYLRIPNIIYPIYLLSFLTNLLKHILHLPKKKLQKLLLLI